MEINFIKTDKKLYRGKLYINKDKYIPTELDLKFLKIFNIPIKIGSFSLKDDSNVYIEWYNSPNEVSNFYKPLFDFIEFKNGNIKLDEKTLSIISNLDYSILNLLLFNDCYNKFIIEKGNILENQNVEISCIKGFDFSDKMYKLLFYITRERSRTYFSKLDILYILNNRRY